MLSSVRELLYLKTQRMIVNKTWYENLSKIRRCRQVMPKKNTYYFSDKVQAGNSKSNGVTILIFYTFLRKSIMQLLRSSK